MEKRERLDKYQDLCDAGSVERVKKRYPGLSDVPSDIVAMLQGGDHKAFEYIYLHYSDSLTDFLSSLLRSREEAEEITQDVFVSLWEKRDRLDPSKGLRRYMYQLAKFYALDHFAHRKVRAKYEAFSRRGDVYDLAADDIMQGDEAALIIEIAISRMPARQREVFLMNREQKMSYEEIAAKLGISKNTVRNHIAASLKELRELLAMLTVIFFI